MEARSRPAMEIAISPRSSQLRTTRRKLRCGLDSRFAADPAHYEALEIVANELLGAAFESGVRKSLILSVEMFARVTSVRVRCSGNVELRDEPFGVRERVLQGLAFAWGKRSYQDGSVDLWAEIARPASRVNSGG
jgi:hypothetical protein